MYKIPVSGTMAHSFITSFKEEIDAFRAFAETFGDQTVLLIDTYDTLAGAEKAVEVGTEMAQRGGKLKGVRMDSGDMTQLSKQVREILNNAGFKNVKIFASAAGSMNLRSPTRWPKALKSMHSASVPRWVSQPTVRIRILHTSWFNTTEDRY